MTNMQPVMALQGNIIIILFSVFFFPEIKSVVN